MSDEMLERMAGQIEKLTDALDEDFPGQQLEGESAVDAVLRLLGEARKLSVKPETVSFTIRWPVDLRDEVLEAIRERGLSLNAMTQLAVRLYLLDL